MFVYNTSINATVKRSELSASGGNSNLKETKNIRELKTKIQKGKTKNRKDLTYSTLKLRKQ